MKTQTKIQISVALFSVFIITASIYSCNPPGTQPTVPSQQSMIERGKYLVTIGSCHDCHSPKIFMPDGSLLPDTSKLLSGHPGGTAVLPPIDTSEIRPGKWYLGSADLTTWVGPWGISFTANLTPDTMTGLGAWTEENFIGTMRKGKHLGQDGGRAILPPMPWAFIGQATDEDLKGIFAYLKSLKPVVNQVPTPTPPTDLASLGATPK